MTTNHFNGLSEPEAERLALLASECSEVVKAVTKILLHGYNSHNPESFDKSNNRMLLSKEIGDVQVALAMMITAGDISVSAVNAQAAYKRKAVYKWLHHNLVTPTEEKDENNGTQKQ